MGVGKGHKSTIRRSLGLTASGILLAAAALTGLAPSASAAGGSTPGLYASPASYVAGTNLLFSTQVTQKPSRSANVFWAHQFSVNNGGASDGGYVGIQTKENGSGQNLMLFSVWGAVGCEAPSANEGHCVGDTDGASGQSVRIWKKWNQGTQYRLSTSAISGRPGWWNAAIIDTSTGERASIGNLRFGDGSTTLTPVSSWVEYWNWNNPNAQCRDQENSSAIYRPLQVDGRTIRYGSTDTSKDCASTSSTRVNSDGSATLTSTSYGVG